MGRNPLLRTLVVVLLASGLGSYVWFVERKKPAPTDDRPAEKVFVGLDKARINAITLAKSGGETVALAREGAGWKLTRPMAVEADGVEVDSLLSSVESLEIGAVANPNATSLAEYGLEPAKVTVTLDRDGAPPLVLWLGDKAPADSGTYARLPSSPRVFTLPSTYDTAFEKSAFDLRDRNVLHVGRDDVKSIEVTGPDGSYSVARDGADGWAFTRPFRSAAARWSVDSLLGSLESLRMESVAEEDAKDLSAFGLAKPERTVTLALVSGRSKRLEIGKAAEEGKHFAREGSSNLVVVVPKVIAEDLGKGASELRAKRVLDVAAYEVAAVEIATAGKVSRFTKPTGEAPDGTEGDKWKRIEEVLFKMGGVEATSFIDTPAPLASYGLDKPSLKATIERTDGRGAAWFELGRAGGKAFARRQGDESILELDPAKVDDLMKAVEGL